jgi:hypothetical protein
MPVHGKTNGSLPAIHSRGHRGALVKASDHHHASSGRISTMGKPTAVKQVLRHDEIQHRPRISFGATASHHDDGDDETKEIRTRLASHDQEVIRTMIEAAEDDVEASRAQFDHWLYTYDDIQLRFSSTLVCAEIKFKELEQVGRLIFCLHSARRCDRARSGQKNCNKTQTLTGAF